MHNRKKTLKDGWGIRPFLLLSEEAPKEIREGLSNYGTVLLLPPFGKLPGPIASHPDILTFYHKETSTLFTYQEYYEENKALFDVLPVSLSFISEEAGSYPHDLYLDALPLMGTLLSKKAYTAKALLDLYPENHIEMKQGYARCSALHIRNLLVTEDVHIGRAAEKLGMKVLFLEKETIRLPFYNCGFIGGASAVIGDEILLFGTLKYQPYKERLTAFLKDCKVTELSEAPLTDYGSVTVIS